MHSVFCFIFEMIMLDFSNFSMLERHYAFLEKHLNISDFFFVGGSIRDLLLGIDYNPQDIDFTMWGNPFELYEKMSKDWFSHFITEKYGTITLIPKEQPWNIKYELTPFRTESDYLDVRHPDEIFWSDNLLLDVQRRDFKINALYYACKKLKLPLYNEYKQLNFEKIPQVLEKDWFIYLTDKKVLIIQKEALIAQLLPKGKLDSDFLYYLLDMQLIWYALWDLSLSEYRDYDTLHIIIDPAFGLQSLIKRRLETVGNPDQRFREDALRLLRALRFVNVLNQKLLTQASHQHRLIEPDKSEAVLWISHEDSSVVAFPESKVSLFDFDTETWKSIKRNHSLLSSIAKERIYQELSKSFIQGNPFGLIALIDEAEMLPLLFPALAKTKHYDQPIRYHPFDIYAHTILTLYHLQDLNPNFLVRFAMLYHDVGKVGQYKQYGINLSREEIRKLLAGPLNHRFSSGELMEEDFKKLGFSKKEIDEIKRYIREHHTPGEILLSHPNNRAKKLKRLLSEAGYEKVQNLLDINIADRLGMYNPLQNSSDLSDSYYLKELLAHIHRTEWQFKKSDLSISWADIMEHFKLKPGKIVWELLQVAFDRVLWDAQQRNTPKQILANLANYLKHRKWELH